MEMKRIARIHTDFASKFGVPRQSGLVPQLQGRIVFEPEYRNADAVRGMEDFSHYCKSNFTLWRPSRCSSLMRLFLQ